MPDLNLNLPFALDPVNTKAKLSVLSFGAGTDSSAILEMLLENKDGFRDKYAPNDLLIIMSDTQDEFPETYKHVEHVTEQCASAGVEFVFITSDMGYHSDSWLGLRHFYRTKGTIGSKMFPKTCTSRLKLQPIYRFLEQYLAKNYGVTHGNKRGFYQFVSRYGKIDMMLGIAKGEERRVAKADKNPNKWYRENINPVYPLIDLGMDRAACQDYLQTKGLKILPSNCKACPFMSIEELEYLRRFENDSLTDLVELEAAKIARFTHLEAVEVTDKEGNTLFKRDGSPKTTNKNYGVWGTTLLPAKIEQAKEMFAEASDDYIREYRYSHGHCVANAY